MHRRAGSTPCPPPSRSVGGAVGGGEGWRAMFCLGILSREGGSLASKFGGSYSRVDLACFHGKTFWRIYLAGQFGTFNLAGFHEQ